MVSSVTVQPTTSQAISSAGSAAPQAVDAPDARPSQAAQGGAASQASAQAAHANPSYQFDAAAGVVVIQFRADSGKVDVSIPNQQQLKAYAAQRAGDPSSSTASTVT